MIVVTRLGIQMMGRKVPKLAAVTARYEIMRRIAVPCVESAAVPLLWVWRTHESHIGHLTDLAATVMRDHDVNITVAPQDQLGLPGLAGHATSIRWDSDDGYTPNILKWIHGQHLDDGHVLAFPNGWDVDLVNRRLGLRRSGSSVPGFLAGGRTPENCLEVGFHTRLKPTRLTRVETRCHLRGLGGDNASGHWKGTETDDWSVLDECGIRL